MRVSRRSQHRPRRDFLYPLTSHFPSCTNHILSHLLHFPLYPKAHSLSFIPLPFRRKPHIISSVPLHFCRKLHPLPSAAYHNSHITHPHKKLSHPFFRCKFPSFSLPLHNSRKNTSHIFLRVKGILIFNRLQRRKISLTKTKNLRLQRVILHGRRFFCCTICFTSGAGYGTSGINIRSCRASLAITLVFARARHIVFSSTMPLPVRHRVSGKPKQCL